jgi:hypothetical protein
VSTLVHANKTDEVSCEGGLSSIRSDCPEGDEGKPVCKRPSCNSDTEKKACVCPEESVYTPVQSCGVCVCLGENPCAHSLNGKPVLNSSGRIFVIRGS